MRFSKVTKITFYELFVEELVTQWPIQESETMKSKLDEIARIEFTNGFQPSDKTAMLVHKTIANYCSCLAGKSQIPKRLFSLSVHQLQHGGDDVR